ncbi:Gfo/Idh/MocA family oxidoreductase [Pirellulales bacterium]|nr:Gfo/Idh/MocA family oxidoreductase [Pirellulales bacterium]
MSRVRLAVVGVGHLGSIHARLAANLPNVELVAVVDPNPTLRSRSAKETGAAPAEDFRGLIGEIDAAVVATPTSTHAAVAGELLRAGIHCLVEKPLAPNSDAADQLVQLAKRRQTVLQVGHVERFNPALASVRGRLTEPKYIEGRRHTRFSFRSTDVGVVLDLMIHDIDVVLSLVRSTVERVEALGAAVVGKHEDMASARLLFATGAVAHLTASRVSYQSERSMHVFTARRFAAIDFAARQATLIEPSDEILGRTVDLGATPPAQAAETGNRIFTDFLAKSTPEAEETNAIEQELIDFTAAISAGNAPLVTGADGRDAVAVAERILDQIARHQWDGRQDGRVGPAALSVPAIATPAIEPWAEDDTVIWRRKAG